MGPQLTGSSHLHPVRNGQCAGPSTIFPQHPGTCLVGSAPLLFPSLPDDQMATQPGCGCRTKHAGMRWPVSTHVCLPPLISAWCMLCSFLLGSFWFTTVVVSIRGFLSSISGFVETVTLVISAAALEQLKARLKSKSQVGKQLGGVWQSG